MRRVMIGTPSHSGTISVYYANSLMETIRMTSIYGIEIMPIFLPGDALIQRARNDLFKIAHDSGVDDLIWIDSDEAWKAEDFIRLLSFEVDIVGGTARKKKEEEEYVVRILPDQKNIDLSPSGLFEVEGIGCGFTRLSRKALNEIWDSAEELKDGSRSVFEVKVIDGQIYSEDILFCLKARKLGLKIYMAYKITCDHIGQKIYSGNFEQYLLRLHT